MRSFGEYGFDSLTLKEFSELLNKRYEIVTTPAIFFGNDSINSLAEHLSEEYYEIILEKYLADTNKEAEESVDKSDVQLSSQEDLRRSKFESSNRITSKGLDNGDIAIIGMEGLLPGSPTLEEFWKNLESNKDLISEVPKDRWDWRSYANKGGNTRDELRFGGFIEKMKEFDAEFFRISPKEAELMDPQHRLFLQTVYRAIENAGYSPKDLSGQDVGMFVGVQFNEYQGLVTQLENIHAFAATGTSHSILINRVSYLLNLRGPSEAIDTACSSSLVAINRAVSAIKNEECDIAVAGGVS